MLKIHPGRYDDYMKDKTHQEQEENNLQVSESENVDLIEITGTIDTVLASKAMALAEDDVGSWVLITTTDVNLENENLTDYLKSGDK